MTFIPFGEWLPDQPDFNNPGAATITNVVPMTQQSYGAFASPNVLSLNALTGKCLGSYSLTDVNGNAFNFAADGNRLYKLDAATTTFLDVSKSAGGPYTLGADPDAAWAATAFGNRVVFTDFVDPIQTFLVGTDTKFSDLAAAAPKARYCGVVRDFLMVGNTIDPIGGTQPRRVWWPAIGDPTTWPTPGTNAAVQVQSDFQDLEQTDLGQVTGIVGGILAAADGAIFCEHGVYRVSYVGSPVIFDFTVAQGGVSGTKAPRSIIGHRGIAAYLGEDGFYAFDGIQSIPIGAQKVDKTFFRDADPGSLTKVQGIPDPLNRLWIWAYSSTVATGGLFDRLLVYNWAIKRWSKIDLSAYPSEWLTRWLSLGYTLDGLNVFGTLDSLPASLDSRIWVGGLPLLALFNSTHKLTVLTGSNLAPTVETSEIQPFPGRRAKITGLARPIVDAAGSSIAIGTRENVSDGVTYQPAVAANAAGWCPQRVTGRYVRARLTLPGGTAFSHLQGVDVTALPEGRAR